MSYLYEVNNRGLPYGGIPDIELIKKMEETDMKKVDDEDYSIDYNNYIRSEIIDWSQDKPFLESDKTRRDTSLGQSVLNLRYVGTRGELDRPSHPEMFLSFMDQDPRGIDNNPRFDNYQDQISTRMPNLEIRMGNNNSSHTSERPRSNQSLDLARRNLHTTLQYNTKVFYNEYDGKSLNQNIQADYDHNKKPLIYREPLPETLESQTESKKSNNQYTVSSVPMVTMDTELYNINRMNSNQSLNQGRTNTNLQYNQSRHIVPDQSAPDMLTGFDSSSYKMMVGQAVPYMVTQDHPNTDSTYNVVSKCASKPVHMSIIQSLVNEINSQNTELTDTENLNSTKPLVRIDNNIEYIDIDTDLPTSQIASVRKDNLTLVVPNDTKIITNELHPYHFNSGNRCKKHDIKFSIPNVQQVVVGEIDHDHKLCNKCGKHVATFSIPNTVKSTVANLSEYNLHTSDKSRKNILNTNVSDSKKMIVTEMVNPKVNNMTVPRKNNMTTEVPDSRKSMITDIVDTTIDTQELRKNIVTTSVPDPRKSMVTEVVDKTFSELPVRKRNNIEGDNNVNIILVNSDVYLPQYYFKDIEFGKLMNLPSRNNLVSTYTDNTFVKTTEQQPHQEESHIKTNIYKFSDDLHKKLTFSTTEATEDKTTINPTKYYKPPEQNSLYSQTNTDNKWTVSNENSTTKSQKQIRTGTTEDPVLIDIPETNDFETVKSSGFRGNKDIRGDRLDQDILNNVNENIYIDED